MTWTLESVTDLSDKVVLVTGATSGIGLEAARFFRKKGAKLIMACRNTDKMAAVAQSFQAETPGGDILRMQLDVSDLDSVRSFARDFKSSAIAKIDVLLLNAGLMADVREKSPQDLELMFATNHLGHWLLTGLLLDYIRDVPDSRIIAVSSLAHKAVQAIDLDVMKGQRPHVKDAFRIYAETKLANHLFVAEINRRLTASGAQTVAVPAHPGVTASGLFRHVEKNWFMRILTMFSFVFQSAEAGALPLIMAATDTDVNREKYYGPKYLLGMRGPAISDSAKSPVVNDEAKASELWRTSEDICNFRYEFH